MRNFLPSNKLFKICPFRVNNCKGGRNNWETSLMKIRIVVFVLKMEMYKLEREEKHIVRIVHHWYI